MQILLSFSIYKNTKEIFTIGGSKNKTGQINPIHCIRFLSISWVLMGHVFNAGEYFLSKFFLKRRAGSSWIVSGRVWSELDGSEWI
jgi:hypothetical protein